METLIQNHSTKELKEMYSKRMSFLESKWNELMTVQNTMTMEQINSTDFQLKRKRIGGLYNRMNTIIMKPKKDAVRNMLNGINPNLSNMPVGATSITL